MATIGVTPELTPIAQPVPESEPPVALMFAGACAPCAWEGPVRKDSLAALRDHDRHVTTSAHLLAVLAALSADDDDDE